MEAIAQTFDDFFWLFFEYLSPAYSTYSVFTCGKPVDNSKSFVDNLAKSVDNLGVNVENF